MTSTRQARRQAARLWRLCQADGSVSAARVGEVVDRLVASPRAQASAVLSRFVRLLRLDAARRAVRVESATPLDAATRDTVLARLTQTHGRDLDVAFIVDPALIGGLRITVGDDVVDGTVQSELETLEAAFA